MVTPDDSQSPEPVVIVTAGLLGSASTWAFNATVELLRGSSGDRQVASFFTDEINQRDEAELRSASATVIKTHAPQPSLRTLLRLAHLPVVLTVREPCDAVVSVMQRFELEFEEALRRINLSAQALIHLADNADPLILRYEDRFFGDESGIRAIAAHLRLRPSASLIPDIHHRLSPEAIRRDLELATQQTTIGTGSDWHRRHQWHPNHLGDGRIGKYRRLLRRDQTVEIQRATSRFRQLFGYARAANRPELV